MSEAVDNSLGHAIQSIRLAGHQPGLRHSSTHFAAPVIAPVCFSFTLEALRKALAATPADQLALAGLQLPLTTLKPHYEALSAEELQEQRDDSQRQVASLQQQVEAARTREEKLARKKKLQQEITTQEQALADYDRLQSLLNEAPARTEKLAVLAEQLQQLDAQLANSHRCNVRAWRWNKKRCGCRDWAGD
ncbi:MAG: hypothetical protein L0H29_09810 [Sinobacteraceae bacterium]|nr:hypothetical protein [Nevskiaceae bacterium]